MASLAQLMRYGSFGTSGGFTFQLDIPASKFKWDDKRLIRKVGEARAKALRSAGLVVKDRTKRQIGSRSPRVQPVQMTVGQRFGLQLVALVNRVPSEQRVTSWKTTRNPKGMLRQDIQSDYDTRSKTVVIGPSKFPKLNELQEKGGASVRYFKPIPKRARGQKVYGVLTNRTPRYSGLRLDRNRRVRVTQVPSGSPFKFTIRVRPRAYMQKGLEKAMKRIDAEFRDQISGP